MSLEEKRGGKGRGRGLMGFNGDLRQPVKRDYSPQVALDYGHQLAQETPMRQFEGFLYGNAEFWAAWLEKWRGQMVEYRELVS